MLVATLTSLLVVAGILSATAARGHILTRPKSSRQDIGATTSSVNFYIQVLDPANYINFSEEECEDNGGPTAYDDLKASLRPFQANIKALVEPLRRETEAALARPQGRLPIVVKKYCRKVPTLKKYIKRVTNSIQACLDQDGVHRVMSDLYFVNSLLDYVCQNEGSGLAAFIAEGGMECLTSKKLELLSCVTQNFDISPAEYTGDGVWELKTFEMLFALDTKRCVDVRRFQDCFIDVVDFCGEPTTANVLNALFDDLIIKQTSCISSTEDESSTSTVAHLDSLSAQEEFEDFMLKKCERSGGGALAFDSIGESFKMIGSGDDLLDLSRLKLEILYAAVESYSDFESTLTLYCRKVPIVNEIVKFITDTFKPCLEEPYEQLSADIFYNVTSSLLKSACYNDGNGIAAFIAADGVQCLDSKKIALSICAHEAFGVYFEAGGWKMRETPETPFVIDLKDCHDMEKLRNCSVQALAECDDKTASHMVDSMFDIIRDGMLCEELREAKLREEWSEADFQAARMELYLEENCEKHGGPMAYETVKEMPKYLRAGGNLIQMNIDQLRTDLIQAQLNGEVDVVAKKYCRKLPALKKFIKHMKDSVAICLSLETQMDTDFKIDAVLTILDFVCEDEGDRFTKLFISGGLQCISDKHQTLDQCIPNIYRFYSGLAKLREDLDAQEYTAFNQTQECVVDVLNDQCKDPLVAQSMDDLLNSIKRRGREDT